MRRINLVFLAFLLSAVSLLAGALHVAHGIQMRRSAPALLERASRAEADRDLAKAEESLALYLSLRREDGPAWRWYARIVDRRDTDQRRRDRVYLIHMEALRHNSGDMELGRRCAELALDLGRYGDARSYLTELIDRLGTDSGGRVTSDLEELLGRCYRGQARFDEAERSFREAIEHDPARISCYMSLARLLRVDLRRGEAADAEIRSMVGKNPESRPGLRQALAVRAGIRAAGRPGRRPEGPGTGPRRPRGAARRRPGVRAGTGSRPGRESTGRRAGGSIPECRTWPSAWPAWRCGTGISTGPRPSCGERSRPRRPCDLAFELAEVLIFRGKIEGDDQAEGIIARLRAAGFGETLVRFLEAEILFQEQSWAEAIARMETARAVLRSVPRLSSRINLMLADCHGRLGADEQRLDALRRAAEGNQGAESARIELVRVLARSGQLDQAISTLSPLAIAGTNPAVAARPGPAAAGEGGPPAAPTAATGRELESHLREAEKAQWAGAAEPVVLLRLDVLAAQDRLDEARALLLDRWRRSPATWAIGWRWPG